MESDSFENFRRYKILVNEKLAEFVSNFENSPKRTKELIHYQSVINLSKEIIRFNNSEANKLKDLLVEYFDIIKEFDFSIDENNLSKIRSLKTESRKRFHKYIRPVGSYLMFESDFTTKLSIGFYLFIGVIADIIIYYYFTKQIAPLATVIFTGIGILSRKIKKNEQKTFAMFK